MSLAQPVSTAGRDVVHIAATPVAKGFPELVATSSAVPVFNLYPAVASSK